MNLEKKRILDYHASEVSDDNFYAIVRSLNDRQREAYELN